MEMPTARIMIEWILRICTDVLVNGGLTSEDACEAKSRWIVVYGCIDMQFN